VGRFTNCRTRPTSMPHDLRPVELNNQEVDAKGQHEGREEKARQDVAFGRSSWDERIRSRIPRHAECYVPDRNYDQPDRKEQSEAIARPKVRGLCIKQWVSIAKRHAMGPDDPGDGRSDSHDESHGTTDQGHSQHRRRSGTDDDGSGHNHEDAAREGPPQPSCLRSLLRH
jgi:hypothetical protein